VYADDEPQVNAISAVLMDSETGRVLWEKDCDKPMAMASTTKIMTCIIALENGSLDDEVVVGKNATLAPPVKMYLTEGEKIRLEDLLYALMLQSSNDAAVAVAEHIGGSVENFCEMMNTKAAELGCKDTVFETPNGLDKGNHHSTAREMAVITRYALKNEEFVRIINTPNADFTTNKKHYAFANKDRLLTEYEGAMGVKTGFTGKAGHCFVGAAKRGDRQLISVVLASGWGSVGKSRKWSDTKAILDYGFNNFEKTPIIQKGAELSAACVDRAKESSVPLAAEEDVSILMKKGENVDYKLKIDKPYFISAPVKKGDAVGKADVYVNGNKIGETKLVATRDIERFCFEDNFKNIFKKWFLVE
jgi:D-alanyl-D-alanine carboxypeptidase (penicillin-binding protein 5/6)